MQGAGFFRVALLALVGFLGYRFLFGESSQVIRGQPIVQEPHVVPAERAPYQYCELQTEYFRAQLSTRGAALKHFQLLKPKYQDKAKAAPIDLSTTPHPGVALGSPAAEDPAAPGLHEFRQQLFSEWRTEGIGPEGADWNVKYDSMDYQLGEATPGSCEFVYRDEQVAIRKIVRASDRPYLLEVTNEITNLATDPKVHAFSIDTVAWRRTEEVSSSMFGVSPFITHVECVPEQGDALRFLPDAFDSDDFQSGDEYDVVQPWGWYKARTAPSIAAVSNAYFTQGLGHVSSPGAPSCQLLIENHFRDGRAQDPSSGSFYRARLAYPQWSLPPGETARYVVTSYVGPKERAILAEAGGDRQRFLELIDLGFFSVIAKVLVTFLLGVHGVVPNWGIAIIVLTVTARVLLFPLSWPSIRNMIRMRELKPEMDALNEKFKNDPQAKGLAQMELWRKHNVNPLKGCLPQLASMPVWFALYTTLQTAVELYNIPFLWFPDLSASDPYFILPLIIGATYFLQQKLMPMQGGDPMQQKMMLYFMPVMFTVFMLFLPAGLGVYMFTNSVLVIVQQQLVERHVKRNSTPTNPTHPVLDKGKV
jgi:YidC/Oxa1 family membrane protein insertase